MIGGGGTGAALAHDLTLRGLDVSLLERGELFSGATGRHHGLLHSGARYAVHDAYRLPLSFLASANIRGAVVRRFTEVVDFVRRGGAIRGVRVRDGLDGREGVLEGDVVVNAAGAWAGHHGSCGTCGCTIDSVERLASVTKLGERRVLESSTE